MSQPPLFTRAFVWLALAQALQALSYASMILFPRYLHHLEASRTEIGLIMAAGSVGGLASRPVVGWALDTVGRKRTLWIGTVLVVASMLSVGWITRIDGAVVALRVVFGAGVGALFTGYFTLASDIIPSSRRTEGIAIFGIAGLIPLLINPFADELGVAPMDLRWFLPLTGAVVALSMPLLALVEVPPRSQGHGEREESESTTTSVWDALTARPLWSVWLATAVFAGMVTVFMTFLSVVVEQRGVGRPGDPWITYAFGAIGVRMFGATLPDRVGRGRVLGAAMCCYVVATWLAAEAHTVFGILLAGALGGLGHGYAFPVLMANVVSRSPDNLRGTAVATFTGTWDASKLLLPFVFGFVADGWGDTWMLRSVALSALGGVAAWAWLERGLPSGHVMNSASE